MKTVNSKKDKIADATRLTDFGFQDVPFEDKSHKVREVFDSVAGKYDLMNDLMSAGLHRAWKRFAVSQTGLRSGDSALDVAGGTGDLSLLLAARVGRSGSIVLSDINAKMLQVGRARLLDEGRTNFECILANAEELPFAEESFDCVTIAFGLRNVTDKAAALSSMQRVLKPGGRLLVLEFSHPTAPALKPFYDIYSFHVLPRLGQLVAGDAASYRYLAESIRRHPDQETLLEMMSQQGLERCSYHNLSGGIVALHRGYKF